MTSTNRDFALWRALDVVSAQVSSGVVFDVATVLVAFLDAGGGSDTTRHTALLHAAREWRGKLYGSAGAHEVVATAAEYLAFLDPPAPAASPQAAPSAPAPARPSSAARPRSPAASPAASRVAASESSIGAVTTPMVGREGEAGNGATAQPPPKRSRPTKTARPPP